MNNKHFKYSKVDKKEPEIAAIPVKATEERKFTLEEMRDAFMEGHWQCEEGRPKKDSMYRYFKEKFNINLNP